MAKFKELTGQKFNMLTAQYRININGKWCWHCVCDCGKETDVITNYLVSGHTKSCGCLIHKVNDIAGNRYGDLVALFPTMKRSRRSVVWHCKCKCGNEIDVSNKDLISLNVQSCGCRNNKIDLIGQRFGKLTVIEDTGLREHGAVKWKCLCDCGATKIVRSSHLLDKTRPVKSCGCINSKGEQKIANILSENGISFQREAKFDSCKTNNTKLRFDFYVNNKYLIEYDGIQHFVIGEGTYDNPKKFNHTKTCDEIKNQWCIDNNIPLIRIPYTHLEQITIEDLILESSKFVYNKKD